MARERAAAERGRFFDFAKYDVLEEVGHGGMATVYRARDKRLGRDVAIKVIHPHLRDSPEVSHRFGVEAQAVAKLRHPNIVEVFDVSADDEREKYLVVELLGGRTLRQILKDHGALPPEVGAALVIELLQALAHAHESGVVHRDVKPENVIIELRGEGSERRAIVKLMDFGIAKLLDAQGVTSTGQVLGSPAHMAPEQIEGGEVDARADIFGLGVLFYESIVGHLPFEGNNPAQVLRRVLEGKYSKAELEKPIVGSRWSHIIDSALREKPDDRYATARDMKDAVTREFARVEIAEPRAELEQWLADPDEFAAAYKAKMIHSLCSLAADARRRGDTLSAASDCNRALAFAPDDPELMKLVASIHRAVARATWARQSLWALLAMFLLAGISFGVTSLMRARRAHATSTSTNAASASAEISPQASAPIALAIGPTAVGQTPSSRPSAGMIPSVKPPARAVRRELVIGTVRPPQGVSLVVDGQSSIPIASGARVTLDGEAHSLTFSCVMDLCVAPLERAVSKGDADVPMEITLTVRPALLVVDGEISSSYQIEQHPTLSLRPGVSTSVPMRGGKEDVSVLQLPSSRRQSVTLRAGKEVRVVFSE